MKKLQLISILFFAPLILLGQKKEVKIKFHHGAYYDVFVIEDGKETNLTDFDQWTVVEDLEISKDKKYFFFRHKPAKAKAYKLTVYDLENVSEMGEIVPGYGGTFGWNELNQIIHWWGCGTNCSNLRVYDPFLEEQFFALSSGGFMFSPNKNFVFQFNMYSSRFWLFDLNTIEDETIKVFSEKEGFNKTGDQINFDLWSLKFSDSNKFQFFAPEDSGSSEMLDYDISKLKFSKVKYMELGEF